MSGVSNGYVYARVSIKKFVLFPFFLGGAFGFICTLLLAFGFEF